MSNSTNVDAIVDRLMLKFHTTVPKSKKRKKVPPRIARPEAFPPVPRHHQIVCGVVTALYKRAQCAATFKSWGTPEQIAARIMKIKNPSESKSPVTPSRLFPSQPVVQSLSSLADLE